jgi:hypothetical protein
MTRQLLVAHAEHIVPTLAQQVCDFNGQVLVGLEVHATASGSFTIRSLTISEGIWKLRRPAKTHPLPFVKLGDIGTWVPIAEP